MAKTSLLQYRLLNPGWNNDECARPFRPNTPYAEATGWEALDLLMPIENPYRYFGAVFYKHVRTVRLPPNITKTTSIERDAHVPYDYPHLARGHLRLESGTLYKRLHLMCGATKVSDIWTPLFSLAGRRFRTYLLERRAAPAQAWAHTFWDRSCLRDPTQHQFYRGRRYDPAQIEPVFAAVDEAVNGFERGRELAEAVVPPAAFPIRREINLDISFESLSRVARSLFHLCECRRGGWRLR